MDFKLIAQRQKISPRFQWPWHYIPPYPILPDNVRIQQLVAIVRRGKSKLERKVSEWGVVGELVETFSGRRIPRFRSGLPVFRAVKGHEPDKRDRYCDLGDVE